MAAKLEKGGLRAVMESADLKEKGLWYRIRLEGYRSINEAKAEGKRLQEAGLIQDFWIVP